MPRVLRYTQKDKGRWWFFLKKQSVAESAWSLQCKSSLLHMKKAASHRNLRDGLFF